MDYENNLERELASVEVISEIIEHDNSHSLEIAIIKGWKVVVKKGEFKKGDLCVYCEIDSILPELEIFNFLKDRNYRIKTTKIRGYISQGICFNTDIINKVNPSIEIDIKEGLPLTKILGIKKYVSESNNLNNNDLLPFPTFIKKTDQPRFNNVLSEIKSRLNQDMLVTEKIDGTSFTAYYKDGYFGICSIDYEIPLSVKTEHTNFVLDNKLNQTFKEISNQLGVNIAIQGELIGKKIQGNKYNLQENKLFIFNVFILDSEDKNMVKKYNKINKNDTLYTETIQTIVDTLKNSSQNIQTVPVCGIVNFSSVEYVTIDFLTDLSKRKSVVNDIQAEGVVVRCDDGFSFKSINPDFLLKYE